MNVDEALVEKGTTILRIKNLPSIGAYAVAIC
jgi:hypothetical protein